MIGSFQADCARTTIPPVVAFSSLKNGKCEVQWICFLQCSCAENFRMFRCLSLFFLHQKTTNLREDFSYMQKAGIERCASVNPRRFGIKIQEK